MSDRALDVLIFTAIGLAVAALFLGPLAPLIWPPPFYMLVIP
ncbi:hypothetical protein [Mycolicibacterium sp. S2-37]|nr:hypothetical protein [Mycolicibacterium sp. S2-37]